MGVVAPVEEGGGGGGSEEGVEEVDDVDAVFTEGGFEGVEHVEGGKDLGTVGGREEVEIDLFLFGNEEDDEGDAAFAEAVGDVEDGSGDSGDLLGGAIGEEAEVFAVEENGAEGSVWDSQGIVGPRAENNKAEGGGGVTGEVGGERGVGPRAGEGSGAEGFGVEAGGGSRRGGGRLGSGVGVEPGIDGLAGEEVAVEFAGGEVPDDDAGLRVKGGGGQVAPEFLEWASGMAGAVEDWPAGEGGEGLGKGLGGTGEHETVADDDALPVLAGGEGRVFVAVGVGPDGATGMEFFIGCAEPGKWNGLGEGATADGGCFDRMV